MRSELASITRLTLALTCMLCALCAPACSGMAERAKLTQTEARARAVHALIDAGRYTEAQSSAEELRRSLPESVRDAPSQVSALALDVLVEARWKNGDASEETLARAEQAVRSRRALSNEGDTAQSLRNLGRVLLLAGRSSEAVGVFEAALGTSERVVGSNSPVVADALDALALGLVEVARYDEAERGLHRALQIRQRVSSTEGLEIARTLELTSLVSLRAGRYGAARPPLERALVLRRRAQPDHSETATTLALLGDLLWLEGRASEARDAYTRSAWRLPRKRSGRTIRISLIA